MTLEDAERATFKSLRSVLPWNWQRLQMKIEFTEGSFSPSGSVSRMFAAPLPLVDL
jgi:hypothetical protein